MMSSFEEIKKQMGTVFLFVLSFYSFYYVASVNALQLCSYGRLYSAVCLCLKGHHVRAIALILVSARIPKLLKKFFLVFCRISFASTCKKMRNEQNPGLQEISGFKNAYNKNKN